MSKTYQRYELPTDVWKRVIGYSFGGTSTTGFYVCGRAKVSGFPSGSYGSERIALTLPGYKKGDSPCNIAEFVLDPFGKYILYSKEKDIPSDYNSKGTLIVPILINGKREGLCLYLSSLKEFK